MAIIDKVLQYDEHYFVLLANSHGVQNTASRMNYLLHDVTIDSASCSVHSDTDLVPWGSASGGISLNGPPSFYTTLYAPADNATREYT